MTIYLDFDGTVVEHNYPALGAPNPHALRVIAKLQANGHQLVLNTYRADLNDGSLEEALAYLNSSGEVEPISEYPELKVNPPRFDLEEALRLDELYIDDISEGTPMRPNKVLEWGLMVDWIELERLLINAEICSR
jgi:hypothetical protein